VTMKTVGKLMILLLVLFMVAAGTYYYYPEDDGPWIYNTPSTLIVFTPDGFSNITLVNDGRVDSISLGDILTTYLPHQLDQFFIYTERGNITRGEKHHLLEIVPGTFRFNDSMVLALGAFPEGYLSVMDVAPFILDSLGIEHDLPGPENRMLPQQRTEHVLMVIADGFGYYNYLSQDPERIRNISGLENIAPALTAYPSITNVAVSTIITGRPPSVHGIMERKDHQLRVPDIHERARAANYTSTLIEGNIGFLAIPMSNTVDENDDGMIDDDIFRKATKHLNDNLTTVHFHSIDDYGHEYGSDSEEYGKRVGVVDSYIGMLVENLSHRHGKFVVIVVADHGMHATMEPEGTARKGEHGTFSPVDMVSFLGWQWFKGD